MQNTAPDQQLDLSGGQPGIAMVPPDFRAAADKELTSVTRKKIDPQNCEEYIPENVTRYWELYPGRVHHLVFGPPRLGFPHRIIFLPGAIDGYTRLTVREEVVETAEGNRYIRTEIESTRQPVGHVVLIYNFGVCRNKDDLKAKLLAVFRIDDSTLDDPGGPEGIELPSAQHNSSGRVTAILSRFSGYVIGSGRAAPEG